MSSQTIYTELKNADNKQMWAFAQEINNFRRKAEKIKDIDKIDFTDTDSIRQSVFEHLFTESSKGNAQASDKLGKYLGLEEGKQQLFIELVDFKNAYKDSTTTAKT